MSGKPVPLETKKLMPPSSEPSAPAQPESSPTLDEKVAQAAKEQDLEQRVIETLRTVYDPEIPVNIYELGLIYNLDVKPTGEVAVRMTLTSPACPVAGTLPGEVEAKIKAIPGVTSAKVELVWDPPYRPEMMSEAARLQLGFF